jgi:hypothetical protein
MSNKHWGLDEVDFSRKVYPELRAISAFYRRFLSLFRVDEWKYREIINLLVRSSSRRFFKEFNTTILPKIGDVWTYNLKDNIVLNPMGLELPYLHFMFFKKTQYADTEQYWRDGFWGIPSGFNYNKYNGEILIDNKGVTLSK